MSDILCAKCGEPWDSTGGLHFSHSDLDENDYDDLLKGRGCPCCDVHLDLDEGGYSEESIEAWQRSVERLSEGEPDFMYHTFEMMPPVD